MKKVITGATETAIAEPVQPPVALLGQHQKRARMSVNQQGQLTRCAPELGRAWSARMPRSYAQGVGQRRGI